MFFGKSCQLQSHQSQTDIFPCKRHSCSKTEMIVLSVDNSMKDQNTRTKNLPWFQEFILFIAWIHSCAFVLISVVSARSLPQLLALDGTRHSERQSNLCLDSRLHETKGVKDNIRFANGIHKSVSNVFLQSAEREREHVIKKAVQER